MQIKQVKPGSEFFSRFFAKITLPLVSRIRREAGKWWESEMKLLLRGSLCRARVIFAIKRAKKNSDPD